MTDPRPTATPKCSRCGDEPQVWSTGPLLGLCRTCIENDAIGSKARLEIAAAVPREGVGEPGPTPLPEFLNWIADRLVHVHGESPNVDYVLSLRQRAAYFRERTVSAPSLPEPAGEWPEGAPGQATCQGCYRPYGEPGFPDLIIPCEAWKQISPSGDYGGLLCPSCICAALEKAGIKCEGAFMSGPIESVSRPVMYALRRVETIELAIEGRDNRWAGVRDLLPRPDDRGREERT